MRNEQTRRARHEAAWKKYLETLEKYRNVTNDDDIELTFEEVGSIVDAAMDALSPFWQSLLIAVEEAPPYELPSFTEVRYRDEILPVAPQMLFIDVPEDAHDLPQEIEVKFDVGKIRVGFKETS